jgi:hypothetical protein
VITVPFEISFIAESSIIIVDSIPTHRTLHCIYKHPDLRQRRQMTSLVSSPPVPSEFDDEVDDAYLPIGHVWAYPCKFPSCPDYGKSWLLRSNFLLHLHEQDAHRISLTTPAGRRAIEIDWRYATHPYLPPRVAPDFRSRDDPGEDVWSYSFKDGNGKVVSGKGTMEQMDMHKTSLRLQAERKTAAIGAT